MKKNFIHLLTEVPGSIYINGALLGLIDNKQTMELDVITNCEKIYVNFQPISDKNNYIPYTYILHTQEQVYCDNENVKVIPFPEHQWDIIMKPCAYNEIIESSPLLCKNIGNYYISMINNTKTNIYIYEGQNIVLTTTIPLCQNAKVELQKSLIIIEGIIQKDTYYLMVIDTKDFKIIYSGKSQTIEKTDLTIKSLENMNDILKHSKITKIDLLSKSIEEYYVYSHENDKIYIDKLYIPKAIIENILINDDKELHKLMSQKFQNTTSKQMREYFGNIQDIYLNRHLTSGNIVNYTIYTNNTYKNYSFLIEDNKVLDILENDINELK